MCGSIDVWEEQNLKTPIHPHALTFSALTFSIAQFIFSEQNGNTIMDRVKINTAQNVLLDYEAAGIGDRTIAGIIDGLLLGCYLIFAFNLFDEFYSIGFFLEQTLVK